MSEFVIRNCIAWNVTELGKAASDAKNMNVRVPASAKTRIRVDGRPKFVPMAPSEYRRERAMDAARFENNIASLEARL